MKKIKMAVIIDQKINAGGGYQQSLNAALLTKNLDKELVEVKFYTLSKSNISLLNAHGLKVKYIHFSSIIKIFALIKINSRFKVINNVLEILNFHNFFELYLSKDKIDLVYFLSPSYLSLDLHKLNFIYTVWDLCHRDHPEFPEVRYSNEFEKRELILKKTLPKAVAIIADSKKGKENIIRRYNIDCERVSVMPFKPALGVLKKEKIKKDIIIKKFNLNQIYIFYPAQYWSHKNHIYILDAIYEIKKNYEVPVFAKFTGFDKGNLNFLKSYINKLGIQDRVDFYGFVNDQELKTLYKKSLALVMPSYFGPTNIPPLEAFHLGVPVIYPSDSSLREQVGNAALSMDLEDPHSLVSNIINLIKDKKISNRLKLLGKERLKTIYKVNDLEILENILKRFFRKKLNWE